MSTYRDLCAVDDIANGRYRAFMVNDIGVLVFRMDSALYAGYSIPPFYDSLIGKLIVHGRDREECIARLGRCLGEIVVGGIDTNIALFQELLAQPDIIRGEYDIHWLERWMASQAA